MQNLQVIGNLGADAELRQYNGSQFVSFRVADTTRYQDKEVTTWIDCTLNGNGGNLLPFLKQGAKVFVTGRPTYRVFDSAKYHCKMVGVSLFVNQIELCGGSTDIVPRELISPDGVVTKVQKYYAITDETQWGKTFTDKNLMKYVCNENGWVAPAMEKGGE